MDHFDLIELISAHHAALLGAVGARFLAVARGVGEVFAGQFIQGEDFVAVQIHKRRLRGREDEFLGFGALQPEHVLFEFGELSGGVARIVVQKVGREDHLVAVIDVGVDEVIEKRPLKTRAKIGVDPGAGAADLRGAFVID